MRYPRPLTFLYNLALLRTTSFPSIWDMLILTTFLLRKGSQIGIQPYCSVIDHIPTSQRPHPYIYDGAYIFSLDKSEDLLVILGVQLLSIYN